MIEFEIMRQKLDISVEGVLMQIERLKEDCSLLYGANSEKESWKYNIKRINDERYLKIEVYNSTKWLSKLNELVEETEMITAELTNDKRIKDLRHMTEHEDEYLEGKGHYKSRYIDKITNLSASDTGISKNEYLIGGRLELSYVEEKFNEIRKILEKNVFTIRLKNF